MDVVARVAARIDHVFILEPVALAADLELAIRQQDAKRIRSGPLRSRLHYKVYEARLPHVTACARVLEERAEHATSVWHRLCLQPASD